ncbi:MAG: hypothetical protein JW751_21315 [Polyangiaceae bacterium]|nr:hypothetical protein [Polyangiaceae bacterium]
MSRAWCRVFGSALAAGILLARPSVAEEPVEPTPSPELPAAEPSPEPGAPEPPAVEPEPPSEPPVAEPEPPSEPPAVEAGPELPATAPSLTEPGSPSEPEPPPPAGSLPPPTLAYPPPPTASSPSWTTVSSPSSAGPSTTPPAASPPPRLSSTTPSFSPAGTPSSDIGGPASSEPDEKKKQDGLFGPIRIGPVVGGGLPNLLSFGGQLKVTRYFAAGVNIGLIPTVRISFYGEAKLEYQEYDVYARIHPLGGAFFLGAGVGYENVHGTLAKRFDISAYQALDPTLPRFFDLRSEGSVETMILTPQLGLFHTFKPGFSIGLDVGAQIPIAHSDVRFATEVPASVPQAVVDAYVTPTNEKVKDTLKRVGQTILPTINLRIGWLL